MLVVLETLSPLERAAFLLREAFEFSFAEIADVLGRPESSIGQLLCRARMHVRDRRPRFRPGWPSQRETREPRRTIMHPLFVTLFIETDADDLLAEEQDRKRRARAARRGRSARIIRAAAANPGRPRRP